MAVTELVRCKSCNSSSFEWVFHSMEVLQQSHDLICHHFLNTSRNGTWWGVHSGAITNIKKMHKVGRFFVPYWNYSFQMVGEIYTWQNHKASIAYLCNKLIWNMWKNLTNHANHGSYPCVLSSAQPSGDIVASKTSNCVMSVAPTWLNAAFSSKRPPSPGGLLPQTMALSSPRELSHH